MKINTSYLEQILNISKNIQRESFTVDGTELIVEDRLNTLTPWRSERVLWIAGTDAYYSVVPICPAWHHLLCFKFCEDVLKEHQPGFLRHALVLGCGGGAVPRWLLEEYPDLQVDVVDRSPEIIEVCKKYFIHEWENCDRLHIYCKDAQEYEQSVFQYEFIFCDLFDGTNLAPVVYDDNFAKKLSAMTADGGDLVINCGWGSLEDVKRAFQPVFDSVENIEREPWQTQVVRAYKLKA